MTEQAVGSSPAATGWSLRRSAAAHVVVDDVGDDADGWIELDRDVEHHLRRVLRLRDGEAVTITDLAGRWRGATALVTRDRVELTPTSSVFVEAPPAFVLRLAVAIPKGDRLDWMVQKSTELGVDRLTLLHADRSSTRWSGERAAAQMERVRRVAVEACRQSRRVWGVTIDGPVPAIEVLPHAVAAEPGGRALGAYDATIAIGPEGGWSNEELKAARDHVSVGENILRVETAALAATALSVATRHRGWS